MAKSIKIQLEDIYEPVTQAQINDAKRFVLRREDTATALGSLIDSLLSDAAEKIARICLRYGVDPEKFVISSKYNEKMMDEVADVMNALEEEILDYICDYSTRCANDQENKGLILLFILSLGRDNMNLKETLERRLRFFLKDIEAMIAVSALTKLHQAKAITLIKSYLHTVYQMPGMTAAFANASKFKAENIRNRGVKHGNIGNSNSEANNIVRFGKMTLQMGWMHYKQKEYEDAGAAGYYVLRGSDYPCDLCERNKGFHTIDDKEGFPPVHGNCVCYAVPVFEKDINKFMQ